MIDPHGGSLVNRVLDPEAASELEARAGSMRRIVLGARESSDLRMISIGAFSPLTGFLRSDDYASVVADSRLTTGEVWTIPITLALEAGDAAGIGQGEDLALYDTDGNLLGAMTAEDIFRTTPGSKRGKCFGLKTRTTPESPTFMRRVKCWLAGRYGPCRGARSRCMRTPTGPLPPPGRFTNRTGGAQSLGSRLEIRSTVRTNTS